MRVARVLGVSILIAICSALASPGWANGGESGGTACEVYPTRMDPKVGEWAFVTVCEAESLGPPPVLRIGTRDLPLTPVNTVKEGSRLAALWVVRDVVSEPADAIQLVFPETGAVVPVSRFDAKAVPKWGYRAGMVGLVLRAGAVEFPLVERRVPPVVIPVSVGEVRIVDPLLATWLHRLGVQQISKTLSSKREVQDDLATRGYSLRFSGEVCPYAVIEILSQLEVVEWVGPEGVVRMDAGPEGLNLRPELKRQGGPERTDCFAQQHYLHSGDEASATWAQGVWEYATGVGARIVVIDCSINPVWAPDIADKRLTQPWDPYLACDPDPLRHGELMGVIAAGVGTCGGLCGWLGVAPGAELAHVRLCDGSSVPEAVAAMGHYIDDVMWSDDIVLMAWSTPLDDPQMRSKIEAMYAAGVWMFAADEGGYPAGYTTEVFGVSGVNREGYLVSGSGMYTRCTAAHWDVPVQVRYPWCYQLVDGGWPSDTTSSRPTAIMAGVAALVGSLEGFGDLYGKMDQHCRDGWILAVPESSPEDVVTFLADRTEAGPVVVAWTTEVEHTQGYFLLSRSGISPTGPWTPADSTATLGGLHSGASYEIVDGSAPAGDLWYRLEQVDGVTGAHFNAYPPCEARDPDWRDRLRDRLAQSDSTGIPPRAHAAGQLSRAAGANSGE
jgi:hypothetical protein